MPDKSHGRIVWNTDWENIELQHFYPDTYIEPVVVPPKNIKPIAGTDPVPQFPRFGRESIDLNTNHVGSELLFGGYTAVETNITIRSQDQSQEETLISQIMHTAQASSTRHELIADKAKLSWMDNENAERYTALISGYGIPYDPDKPIQIGGKSYLPIVYPGGTQSYAYSVSSFVLEGGIPFEENGPLPNAYLELDFRSLHQPDLSDIIGFCPPPQKPGEEPPWEQRPWINSDNKHKYAPGHPLELGLYTVLVEVASEAQTE